MLENHYCFAPYQPGEKGESEITPAELPKDVESLTRFGDLEPSGGTCGSGYAYCAEITPAKFPDKYVFIN
jgi:hypothetical protein